MSEIAKAASVLLARGSSDLFIVRRAEKLRFFGGFFAFPGGNSAVEPLTGEPETGTPALWVFAGVVSPSTPARAEASKSANRFSQASLSAELEASLP